MSELKCPACGGIRDDDAYVFTGGTVWCCAVCAFECEDKDIPRISAAMELARCIADSDIDWDEGHAKWLWDETKKARARVMEAFK